MSETAPTPEGTAEAKAEAAAFTQLIHDKAEHILSLVKTPEGALDPAGVLVAVKCLLLKIYMTEQIAHMEGFEDGACAIVSDINAGTMDDIIAPRLQVLSLLVSTGGRTH